MNRTLPIRLKIERAKKHISDLDIAVQGFVDSKPYRIGTKPHPIAAIEHTTLFIAGVRSVPDNLTLILGDAIHNLRSALDHLAWQLVEAGGGQPDDRTAFPICETPQQYASALGRGELKRMRMGAEKVLCAVQPYNTLDQNLWLLHRLDIVDKHRLLLAVVSSMDSFGVQFATGHTISFGRDRFVPLKVGDEVTNLPTSTYERQADEDFKLGLDITFGESEVAEGELVLDTAKKLLDLVDGIVGSFEPFL